MKIKQNKKRAFRVKTKDARILKHRKDGIDERIDRGNFNLDMARPVFTASNIHYEVAGRIQATNFGGIGAIHTMVRALGLDQEIDQALHLFKVHLPYHESDHVLNIAYNAVCGALRLEDIELRRNDEAFLNALGAARIPDPTTAGDFTRRMSQSDIMALQEVFNGARQKVWKQHNNLNTKQAVIDIDGTIAPTLGECKQGMDISYKGIWGYAPLIVSLANTREVLYLVNRPGNAPSYEDAPVYIDKAIDLVRENFDSVLLRGDTDFSQTAYLDGWDEQGVEFVFGMDANPALVKRAEQLPTEAWKPLQRERKDPTPANKRRQRPVNVKKEGVKRRCFKNLRLDSEEVAQFQYSPSKCKKAYRIVVVRKNISVEMGDDVLFNEIRYFFYITNVKRFSADEVVFQANQRCDQENVIEQLKNGVNAMRMPVDNLTSNWAYMVMTTLAWNLKSWLGQLTPNEKEGEKIIRMEFRTFYHRFILIATQIVIAGRRILYRILGFNRHLETFLETFAVLRKLRLAPGG